MTKNFENDDFILFENKTKDFSRSVLIVKSQIVAVMSSFNHQAVTYGVIQKPRGQWEVSGRSKICNFYPCLVHKVSTEVGRWSKMNEIVSTWFLNDPLPLFH